MNQLQKRLFEMQDVEYREFHSRLMPNVDKERVIGIRVPELRRFCKEFMKSGEAERFIEELPHYYYEENNLHMMVISEIKHYERCVAEIERFLPYIDNWATCDFGTPKCFKKHKEELLVKVQRWIKSENTYTVRYGIGVLMRLFLDEDFKPEYVEWVAQTHSDEYYVNMMSAWYIATALCKQWDCTVKYLEERRLSDWVHRKAIQKAIESYRITDEQKKYLRTLK